MRVDSVSPRSLNGLSPRRRAAQLRARRIALLAAIASALLLGFALPFLQYFTVYRYTSGHPPPFTHAGFEAIWRMVLAVPSYYVRLVAGGPHAPSVYLDIKPKHVQKLADTRDASLQAGSLVRPPDDFVPAVLRTDEIAVRVRLRLKGDWIDHYQGNRWSFRIETRDGASVFGMRRFSLQAPYTRGFHREALYFDFLRSRGILAPRYFFVDLSVNGRHVGLTALEEHFSKELLEGQQRRESVILKYDESFFWDAIRVFGLGMDTPISFYLNWRSAPVGAFRMARTRSVPSLARYLENSVALLRGVMRDEIPASRVFDAELWGEYLAACEFWSAFHGVELHNLRMYFNPITFELEPVAFDALYAIQPRWGQLPGLQCQGGANFGMTEELFEDRRIRRAFFRSLREIAPLIRSDAFARDLRTREREHLALLRTEFPWLESIDIQELQARAALLASIKEENFRRYRVRPSPEAPEIPEDAEYPTLVHAYLERNGARAHLEIDNLLPREVTLSEIRFWPDSLEQESPFRNVAFRTFPYRLAPSPFRGRPASVEFDFEAPATQADWGVRGVARLDDEGPQFPFSAIQSSAPASAHPIPRPTLSETLSAHPFLQRSPDRKLWLRAEGGTWDVTGWLVLPNGVGLELGAGTVLRFQEGAALLARGPLDFRGTREAPVVLEGRPSGQGRAIWGGVAVLKSDEVSRWSHVVVRDTIGIRRGDWALDAGVTFRRTEVQILDSLLSGTHAEDALNLIRSEFTLSGVEIQNTRSDALDADFCQGSVRGGRIRKVGSDGIDLAGSRVEVEGVEIEQVRDKAISVSERSTLRAKELRVASSGVGVAIKNGARGLVSDSAFVKIEHVGLLAYADTSEYGPPELVAERTRIEARDRPVIAQEGSRVTIDGQEIEPETIDAAAIYDSPFKSR